MQVVYIEDNASNVLLMQRIFRLRPDLELLVATSGAAGLELVRRTEPALVLLDLQLPDMLGQHVLRALKAGSQTAPIPVVVISGERMDSGSEARQLAGAAEIIAKPFVLSALLHSIDRCCDLARPVDPVANGSSWTPKGRVGSDETPK